MAVTIGETVQQLQDSLRDYIEATYHVSDPTLVTQRQRILQKPGVIYQEPYLESTPRYKSGSLLRGSRTRLCKPRSLLGRLKE